ncbi:MAG TPA: tail fiber protein [Croceibacterium sp.]|jgi:microcystin-dependent protein
MGAPYIGEIRLFAGSFAPAGWAICNGQTMAISENDALFNLIGTTYGGDGQETFNLPDLQGRVPVHVGGNQGYVIGEKGGVESVTLSANQIPVHTHAPQVATGGAGGNSAVATASTVLADASSTTTNVYKAFNAADAQVALNSSTIQPAGGNQPHDNFQPTLAITYIISLFGVYPTQT